MSWEARKYKDIIDTLTSNTMQLELNIKGIEGYLHIIDSKTCNQLLEEIRDNLNDIKSDIKAEGDANAALKIENGSIGVEAEGNGNIKATVEDKEVLDANFNAKGSATASKDGIEAESKASQ